MDMLLPSDKKRYAPHKIAHDLQGRSDLVNAEIDKAELIFNRYADLIEAVGTGNHETHVEDVASFDPVQEFINRLSNYKGGPKIGYLGYTGFVVFPIYWNGRHTYDYSVWFHHGSGKGADPAVALTRLMKAQLGFEADVYWSGHSHTRATADTIVLTHSGYGKVFPKHVRFLITGSYQNGYQAMDGTDLVMKGRRGTYPSDMCLRPSGVGGARSVIEFDRPGPPSRVLITQ